MKDAIKAFPARLKELREARGLTQERFIPTVNAAAKELFGEEARVYSQSTYSRLESGRQDPTLEDVAVMAACDTQGRGMLWLGYDTLEDFTALGGEQARSPQSVTMLPEIVAGRGSPSEPITEAKPDRKKKA